MTANQITVLLPFIVRAGLPVVLLLAIAVYRNARLSLGLTLTGLALALVTLAPPQGAVPAMVTPLLTVDGLSLCFIALAALAGAATVLLAHAGAAPADEPAEELHVLVSLAVLGAAVLAASRHLASLFLGLELISVSLFPMIAYARGRPEALEAGIKSLVLSSVATGLLLFGTALLYTGLGSLELTAIGRALAHGSGTQIWVLGGMALVLAGLAMKLSLVPLHWWTPDVYEGATPAVTGFLASIAKTAVVVVLLRLLLASDALTQAPVMVVLAGLAVLSMLVGNLLALRQRQVVRILAYSSIAHMGYLLVALLAAGTLGIEAVAFYLAAYVITALGAFGALGLVGPETGDLDALRGLSGRRPWRAAGFTLMLLSLAGIPLTAGFIGKVYLLAAGVESSLWLPVGVLVATSVVGLFYYLRIIFALYSAPPARAIAAPAFRPPTLAGGTTLAALTLALLLLGTWPEPVIELFRAAIDASL